MILILLAQTLNLNLQRIETFYKTETLFMQEKVLLDKNRNISLLIVDSFKFLRQEFRGLIQHYLVFVAPLFLGLGYLIQNSDILELQKTVQEISNETDVEIIQDVLRSIDMNPIWLIGLGFSFIGLIFLGVTLIYIRTYHLNASYKLSISEMGSQLLYEFPKLFIIQFFYLSMALFGLMTFLIPGVYFLVTFSIASIHMVIEDDKIFKSLSQSIRISHKSWFTFLWYSINIFIAYAVVSFILRAPISYIISRLYPLEEISSQEFAISASIESFINLLCFSIALVAMSMLYFSFKNHRIHYREIVKSEFNKTDSTID